jgi:hypothetical protein
MHYREITIGGAFGRGTAFRRALAQMPTLGVKRLITGQFPLAKISDAFAHATAGRRREDGHPAEYRLNRRDAFQVAG